MGIEKPHHQPEQQRDLFSELLKEVDEAITPQPETLPSFSELKNEFFELTGYKAEDYGFVTTEDHYQALGSFLKDLRFEHSQPDRIALLIGLTSELDKGLKWWQK